MTKRSPWSTPKPDVVEHAEMPATTCKCGKTLDMVTATEICGGPEPGDVSVCWYCGAVTKFDKNLRLVEPDEIEAVLLAADPKIKRMRQRMKLYRSIVAAGRVPVVLKEG